MKTNAPRWPALAALFVFLCAGFAHAQTEQRDGAALSMYQDAFQLTNAQPSATRPIKVDSTASISVFVTSVAKNLTVALVAPDSTRYQVGDPPTAAFQNGIVPDPVMNPTASGANYLMTIAGPQTGNWSLEVTSAPAPVSPLDVLVAALINNQTRITFFGGGEDYPVGASMRFYLAAFDGNLKVSTLTASARLFRENDPGFPEQAVVFKDDGTGGDQTAADGIYTATVVLATPGNYQIQANVDGTASTGAFRRSAAAAFRVVPRDVTLDGSFTDRGIDTDADTQFNKIGVAPHGTINVAGSYNVTVVLSASNGKSIQRSLLVALPAGAASPEVTFDAADILSDLQVAGPWHVKQVRFDEIVSGTPTPADIRYDLGDTQAYSLSQLQHPAVLLTGVVTAVGVDTNANGLFDQFEVTMGVVLKTAGLYSVTGSLVDSRGKEIDFISGSANFPAGEVNFIVTYSGSKIGANNVDGPYDLRNYLFYGAGGSAISNFVGSTPLFLAQQFEGFTGKRGDANGDSIVNVADLFYLINGLFAGGQPPLNLKGGDANNDGVVSVADVFFLINFLFAGGPPPAP